MHPLKSRFLEAGETPSDDLDGHIVSETKTPPSSAKKATRDMSFVSSPASRASTAKIVQVAEDDISKHIPHVDLRAGTVRKNGVTQDPEIASQSRMKCKGAIELTLPSPVPSGTFGSSSMSEETGFGTNEYILPVKMWALGTRVIESLTSDSDEPRFWLYVGVDKISLLSHCKTSRKDAIFEYKLGDDISCVEIPHNETVAQKFPLIIFTLRENQRTANLIRDNDCIAKQSKPTIAVRLSTTHSKWGLPLYKAVEYLLKTGEAVVCNLNEISLRSRWKSISTVDTEVAPGGKSAEIPKRKPKPRPRYAEARMSSSQTRRTVSVPSFSTETQEMITCGEEGQFSPASIAEFQTPIITEMSQQPLGARRDVVSASKVAVNMHPQPSHSVQGTLVQTDETLLDEIRKFVQMGSTSTASGTSEDVEYDHEELLATSEKLGLIYQQIEGAVHKAIDVLSSY